MAIGELSRMIHAANAIFEGVANAAKVSRRAAHALVIMALDTECNGVFSNDWLREQFLLHRISTQKSVAKDASTAKSELQEIEYIRIGKHHNEFVLTELGVAMLPRMHEAEVAAIDKLDLPQELRKIVRKLSNMKVVQEADSKVG
jgi:hypothetical protein